MKYKVKQLESGEYAVFTGKRYYTHTVTSNRYKAETISAEMSAQWYLEQIDKCEKHWDKHKLAGGRDQDTNWGDVLA